ncbi:hypothetical protein BRCON_0524 [Candidatus Sumerlaea chitinivorans]|uniref:Uncharacterized protein n=1 Tax=Sumerlaea chitinivorans TaxID=2250252 RepID=A0A2Z4Y2C2_SUMC1|nr:hypothetical protein BRCON_0524 [Candidatus Sumerlaea chitinivorans]
MQTNIPIKSRGPFRFNFLMALSPHSRMRIGKASDALLAACFTKTDHSIPEQDWW